jgi:hypothetical protein
MKLSYMNQKVKKAGFWIIGLSFLIPISFFLYFIIRHRGFGFFEANEFRTSFIPVLMGFMGVILIGIILLESHTIDA